MTTSPIQGTAVVVGGNRTPFAKAGGHYAGASNLDMLTATIDALIARHAVCARDKLAQDVAARRGQHSLTGRL